MRSGMCAVVGLLAALGGCSDVVSYHPDAATDAGTAFVDQPAVVDDLAVVGEPDVAVLDDTPDDDAGPGPSDDAGDDPDVGTAPVDAGLRDFSLRGPYIVGTWTGAIPGTATQARALYPTSTTGRVPLVIFAHGFQLAVNNYDGLLAHIASWGYVVVSVDYPGTILSVDHRDVPRAMIAARTALAFGVSGFPATSILDLNHTAVMGHSLGGKGAIMAILDEPAFVAAVALDPVDDNPSPLGTISDATPSIAPEQMGRLARPLALFGGTQSRCQQLGTACAPEASNYLQFAASVPAGAQIGLYPLINFGHQDFVDTACSFQCSLCVHGAAPLDSRQAALRFLSVAFLERYVRGDASLQTYVNGAGRDGYVASGALWDGHAATLPACP